MLSRRDFLINATAVTAAGAVAHPLLSWAADSGLSVPGKEGLIVRSYRFFDLETPVEYLDTWLTPAEHFFVRNHMHEPVALNAADWKLTITGEVETPSTLTLADLAKLEQHSVVNTLECAGNGRAFHNPKVPGVQWQKGDLASVFPADEARAPLMKT